MTSSHISTNESLSQLHWLPVSKRIDFKLATLTYKLLNTQQPSYLRSLINYETPARQLRSSALHRLHQKSVRRTIGQRAFIVLLLLLSIMLFLSPSGLRHQSIHSNVNSKPFILPLLLVNQPPIPSTSDCPCL